jgi:hypothetical protein
MGRDPLRNASLTGIRKDVTTDVGGLTARRGRSNRVRNGTWEWEQALG